MKVLAHLLVPGSHNNHHPHLLRYYGLSFVFYSLLVFTLIYNTYFVSAGSVLGFATEIIPDQVISLTNSQRKSVGASELKNNAQLAAAAQEKAKFMFEKDFWAHNSPDGVTPWFFIEKSGYKYSAAGENLARDFYTTNATVNAWMNSPGHKANILNSGYTEIGVAVVNGKLGGQDTTLVVQMFGRPLGVSAPANQATNPPSQAPVQTQNARATIPIQSVEVSQELQLPSETKPSNGLSLSSSILPKTTLLSNLSIVDSLSLLQKIYLSLIVLLIGAFGLDAYLLYKRGFFRYASHSAIHLLTIILTIPFVLVSSMGMIG